MGVVAMWRRKGATKGMKAWRGKGREAAKGESVPGISRNSLGSGFL
jgi:hypothetical protein